MASPGYERHTIRFGAFHLDVVNRELRKRGRTVKLQPQQFDILLLLAEHAGQVVSRETIRHRIWDSDTFVDFERSINFAINQIRAALRDDAENPRFIETVPKRGYRFIAEIESAHRAALSFPSGPFPVDQEPVADATSKTATSLPEVDEAGVADDPHAEGEPANTSSASRKVLHVFLAGAGIVAILAVIWLVQKRLPRPTPAGVTEQQVTHNSTDSPITSVAVSPDGKYLAFSDLAGLHLKLLTTGEVRNFAEPEDFGKGHENWRICWLPDNTGFLVDAPNMEGPRSTWRVSIVSGTLKLLRKDAYTWSVSPDGSRLAFTAANENELWTMGVKGETPRKWADADAKSWFTFVEWSPDGTRLLYLKHAATANHDLTVLEMRDLSSGTTSTLLSDSAVHSVNWLHDGRILYVKYNPDSKRTTCDYWSTRLVGASLALETPRQITHGNGFCVSSGSSTADGRQLYFLKQAGEFSTYVADLASDANSISPPRHLTLTDSRDFPAAWTADSQEVVFVSDRGDKWGFYRQPLNGDAVTPILTGVTSGGLSAIFPRRSPDGAWLVYAPYPESYSPNDAIDILKVPITGGTPQPIMTAPVYDTPRCTLAPATLCAIAIAKDDQLIFTAFNPLHGQGAELARMKIDGRRSYGWDFSPDGTHIAVLRRGTAEIRILTLRSHKEQTIIVNGWQSLASLDWDANGSGFFTSSLATGSILLHSDLHGRAHVLWEPKGSNMTWAIPSPDRRHVAMPGFALSSNVWKLNNF